MLMYIWIRSQRFLVFIAVLVAAEVAFTHTPRVNDKADHMFLLLAGGQLYEVLQTGQRDAAQIRSRLAEAGLSEEVLRKGLYSFETTRLAHRLSTQKTWLFSGKFDTVVKPRYARALSEKIGLKEEHHVIMT